MQCSARGWCNNSLGYIKHSPVTACDSCIMQPQSLWHHPCALNLKCIKPYLECSKYPTTWSTQNCNSETCTHPIWKYLTLKHVNSCSLTWCQQEINSQSHRATWAQFLYANLRNLTTNEQQLYLAAAKTLWSQGNCLQYICLCIPVPCLNRYEPCLFPV